MIKQPPEAKSTAASISPNSLQSHTKKIDLANISKQEKILMRLKF